MAQPILVTQSTSIVQVDTSQVVFGSPAVVLLSSLNAPGTMVTIRDIAGQASTNRGIVVSTTLGVHFLDGPSCNIYAITQPYGFLTVTPKTSSIWAVTNTFAFPEGSTAANVNQFSANFATISSLFANQASLSTVGISSLSTDTTEVRRTLSVGESTITDSAFVKGGLTALSSISTAGSVFAGSSVVATAGYFRSTIEVPRLDVQLSTGMALNVAGSIQTASNISTLGSIFIGGNLSTQGNLAVGGNFTINGGLTLTGLAITGGVSTSGTLGVAHDVQTLSSLQVKDDATFYRHASIASNVTVGSALSVMSNAFIQGAVQVNSNVLAMQNMSVMSNLNVASSMSIGGNLVVVGNLIFNDVLLDLNALSVFSTLTVGALISTTGSAAIGQGLRVMGSTILQGLVSTGSSMTVGGNFSTTGNLAVGGSVDFCSTLTVRGAVTKLGDVNVGGLLSTQSTLVVGDSIRVTSNVYVGGVLSSLSTVNAAGSLLVGGQAYLSSGLSTVGAAAFFSSVNIQGSVSVMSSLVVRQDVFVQGTLNAAGFSLPGAAAVASLGVQTSTGVSAIFGGSTIQTGLLSTLGGIHMGGQFSTPNTITTGSTLNARFIVATSNISSLGTLGVGGDMSLAGRATLCNLTVTSNLQTTGTSSNVFSGCNIFAAPPYFSNGFNGDETQNYSMGNVIAAGNLQVSQTATFSNQVTAQSNITTSSLTVTGNTLMSNFTSTLGQAAFFSSVAIQGNLSVFSSVNVSCNLNVGGILTAGSFQLPGGAILQTLAVTSNVGFTVNISSSTLHAGLFSTSGAIFSGREISTTSSLMVGGVGYFQTGISTLGQATFASNVQVGGSLVSLSNVVGPSISGMKVQVSSLGLGVANSLNQFDMVGTAAIQGSGRSNTLRLTATDQAPGITLSNTTGNYTLFNTKSADAPGAGALAILDNAETYRMVMLPGGNTAIGKASAAAPLDVNGLAIADRMGAPAAQFSTLGAATASASTLNVLSNINVTAGAFGAYALDIVSATDRGISVRSDGNATLLLSNTTQANAGMTIANVKDAAQYVTNAAAGDSIIRTESAAKKLLFTNGAANATLAITSGSVGIGTVAPATTLDVVGSVTARTSLATASATISTLGVSSMTASTITLGTRQRLIVLAGDGTNTIAYSTDGGVTYTSIAGPSAGGFTLATNGTILVTGGLTSNTLAYSFDGINWVGLGTSIFSGSCYKIIWDGRQFLAVGSGTNTFARSPDGITWTGSNPTAGTVLFDIAYNGSIYMIGYNNGTVFTSSDLVTWTQSGSTNLSAVFSVAWTGTRWLVAGNGNALVYSSVNNGSSWAAVSGFSGVFTDITRNIAVYGNTVIIAGQGTNNLAYSLDSGVTFTLINVVSGALFYSVSWTGDRFIVLGTNASSQGIIYQSFNGISWTQVGTNASIFSALGHAAIGFNYSTRLLETNFGQLAVDSISTSGSLTTGDTLRVGPSTLVANPLLQNVGINCNAPRFTLDVNGNINAGGNLYVAGEVFQGGGGGGPTLSTSRFFASTMTTSSITVTNTLLASNAASTFTFVSGTNINGNSGQLWRTSDGINYTSITLTAPDPLLRIDSVAYNGRIYVVIGTGGNGALAWQSSDGVNWTLITNWSNTLGTPLTVKWNGQYWLIGATDLLNTNRTIVRTFDLITFTNASSGLPTGYISDLAWNGTLWVAVGKDNTFTSGTTQNIRYSYDGLNWLQSVNGFNAGSSSRGTRVLWSGTQFVAVGDDSTSPIKYSYDGIVWYNSANALSVFSYLTANCWGIGYNGKIYVATGSFSNSVADANRLGRIGYSYDGITWSNALSNNIFTNRGFGVGWTGTQWIVGGQDSNAANTSIRTSTDGIYWTPSVTTSVGTSLQPFSVNLNSNVIPDAQIGNTSFYSKQQPTFLTSTNTVQQFSNGLILNQLYTDSTGKVGINCNAPGGSALAVNGFVTMNKSKDPITIVWPVNIGAGSNARVSVNNGSNWVIAQGLTSQPFGNASVWDGRRFLLAATTNGTGGNRTLQTSSNGVVWTTITVSGTLANYYINRIIWTGTGYIAVGLHTTNSNASICQSTDAVTWSAVSANGFTPANAGVGNDVAFNGRTMVAVGQDTGGNSIKLSTDMGTTWTNATAGGFSAFINGTNSFGGYGVATNGRIFVAVGSDSSRATTIKYSFNSGSNWSNCATGGFSGVGRRVAWNGRYFLAVGEDTVNSIQYSLDGISWIGVSWASATYSLNQTVIWTGTEWRIGGFLASGSGYTVTATGATPPVVGTAVSFTGQGGSGDMCYSSNVYPDLQVEDLAIYGRNQVPTNLSTNYIYLSSNAMSLNNLIYLSNNQDSNATVRFTTGQLLITKYSATLNSVSSSTSLLRITESGGVMYIQSGSNETSGSRANISFAPMFTTTTNLFLDMVNSRVGVGTSSPLQQLHLNGGGLYITGNATNYGDVNSASFWNQAGIGPTIAGSLIAFNTNGTSERMRITSAGNVGIGITAPTALLHLSNSSNTRLQYLYIAGSQAGIILDSTPGGGKSYNIWANNSAEGAQQGGLAIYDVTGGAYRLNIASNGNVGIGTTTPTNSLHIHKAAASQDVRIQLTDTTTGTAAGDGLQLVKGSDQNCYLFNYENTFLQFGTNGSGRMTIASNGQIGINTTIPRATLEVNGSIYIGGNGSASVPSLAWPDPSDADSGFYHPADGQIGVTINGTNRALFTASGLDVTGRVYTNGHFVAPNVVVQTRYAGTNTQRTFSGAARNGVITDCQLTLTPKQSGTVVVIVSAGFETWLDGGNGFDSWAIDITDGNGSRLSTWYMGLANNTLDVLGRTCGPMACPTMAAHSISGATTFQLRLRQATGCYEADDNIVVRRAWLKVEEFSSV